MLQRFHPTLKATVFIHERRNANTHNLCCSLGRHEQTLSDFTSKYPLSLSADGPPL